MTKCDKMWPRRGHGRRGGNGGGLTRLKGGDCSVVPPPKAWRRYCGSARCPGGTQSACEGTCTYLNFCSSLPALTFLQFPFCTSSCTSLPVLPFLQLLSCTLSWSGVPPGVKFPPENVPFFRDFPLEGRGGLSEIFFMRANLFWSGVPQGVKFPP